jgi:hypothetical protein
MGVLSARFGMEQFAHSGLGSCSHLKAGDCALPALVRRLGDVGQCNQIQRMNLLARMAEQLRNLM